MRKVTKGILFLHDNAPVHRALANQKKLGFQCFDHPPYSPDLSPSDYHLFPGLKKQLKGRHFSSNAEVTAAVETWLDGQPSEFFLSGLQSYSNGLRSALSFLGSMLNKSQVWSL
jgi:histone-lysine N-methyltransferase SETMAR